MVPQHVDRADHGLWPRPGMHERRDRLGNHHRAIQVALVEPVAHHRHQDVQRRFCVGQGLLHATADRNDRKSRHPAARAAASRNPPALSDIYPKMGQVGKEKMHLNSLKSYYRPFALLMLASLSTCGDNAPVTYAGDVVPQAGVCDPAARAVLVRQGHYVRFTPHDGVVILTGEVAPDGAIAAKVTAPSADHKPYEITFHGKLDGQAIIGNYISPRCRAAVSLKRAS